MTIEEEINIFSIFLLWWPWATLHAHGSIHVQKMFKSLLKKSQTKFSYKVEIKMFSYYCVLPHIRTKELTRTLLSSKPHLTPTPLPATPSSAPATTRLTHHKTSHKHSRDSTSSSTCGRVKTARTIRPLRPTPIGIVLSLPPIISPHVRKLTASRILTAPGSTLACAALTANGSSST